MRKDGRNIECQNNKIGKGKCRRKRTQWWAKKMEGGFVLCLWCRVEDLVMLTNIVLSFSFLFSPPHTFLLTSDPESFWPERDTYWPVVQDVRPTHPEADWGVEPVLSHQPQSQGGCVGGQSRGHGLGGWLSGLRGGPRRSVFKIYIITLNLLWDYLFEK